jgi:hypothetical protein
MNSEWHNMKSLQLRIIELRPAYRPLGLLPLPLYDTAKIYGSFVTVDAFTEYNRGLYASEFLLTDDNGHFPTSRCRDEVWCPSDQVVFHRWTLVRKNYKLCVEFYLSTAPATSRPYLYNSPATSTH